MSVLDVLARPRTGSASGRPAGADLRLVPRTRTRPPRVPFVLLVLVLLGVGLVGLLLVNTQLQQGSFVLHELERNLSDVRDREAALERQVANLEAPQTLASRAAALGMVPNPSPGYLVVSGGSDAGVSGDPEPAPTPPPPPRPEPQPEPPPENPGRGDAEARTDGRPSEQTPAAQTPANDGANGRPDEQPTANTANTADRQPGDASGEREDGADDPDTATEGTATEGTATGGER